ncbi:G2-specific protein kinase nim-1 [Pyricularia oryzae]|uniref:non-specific serine/threonine protein kinase n=1 Tax=Pyricularia grisea TaxID=148305 RepID=A0ABQ8NJL2_PYRGI|nr:G2-specific protein kinase nim-1 [Pyricularia grisea]KAI6306686.1 G2-specific protein kinase nim-1 [Pyricularia oryzae]
MPESDNYEVLEKIGHGSFGVIRKVRRKSDGMVVCRKEISYLKMSQKEREQLHAEFQILSTLHHENIVGYFHREHLKSSQDLYLYMEYCGNGDLGRVIRDLQTKNQYAEESFVWSIFSQLVTALYRCHYGINPPEVGKSLFGPVKSTKPVIPPGTMTILHRDLKPENVFLGEGNLVKLGDFGLAKMIQSQDFASTYVGTPFYMSPEISAAEKYTLKSDIWSLGCIIYELCTREPPFNAKTHVQLVQRIREGKISPIPKHYSPDLMEVIKECLRVNPERRPDTATLLHLPHVKMMRKEKELVDCNRMLKQKQEAIRKELNASLHREWEVKARLEIDRILKEEIAGLEKRFEAEVQKRIEEDRQKRPEMDYQKRFEMDYQKRFEADYQKRFDLEFPKKLEEEMRRRYPDTPGSKMDLSWSVPKPKASKSQSSVEEVSADGDESSGPDQPDLSGTSPDSSFSNSNHNEPKRRPRTPYKRAQTMYAGGGRAAGTPMDIEMVSPSPIAIASLSLSPRRHAATTGSPTKNPFSKRNNVQGRTLVELSKARASGRPLFDKSNLISRSEPVATWNPEIDEMPSPFLVRRKGVMPPVSAGR